MGELQIKVGPTDLTLFFFSSSDPPSSLRVLSDAVPSILVRCGGEEATLSWGGTKLTFCSLPHLFGGKRRKQERKRTAGLSPRVADSRKKKESSPWPDLMAPLSAEEKGSGEEKFCALLFQFFSFISFFAT